MAASSAWRLADGGFTCGDAPNAGISAAATARRASTLPAIFTRPGIRSLRASSRARTGSTITKNEPLLKALSCRRHARVPQPSPPPVQRDAFRPIGAHCCTTHKRSGASQKCTRPPCAADRRTIPGATCSACSSAAKPTGKRLKSMSIDVFTVKNARLASAYHVENWVGALQQIRS